MMSKFRGVKTDNRALDIKVKIRNDALSFLSDDASVLDVFAGQGEMYMHVWSKCKNYLGIDKKKFFDTRNLICGDNIKLIRTLDLNSFNVFDIDSYGSPYEILRYVVETINDGDQKKICFCITDGSSMDLKMGRVSQGLRFFTDIDFHILKNAHLIHDRFIDDVINKVCEITSSRVDFVNKYHINYGACMRYYSFVITRNVD